MICALCFSSSIPLRTSPFMKLVVIWVLFIRNCETDHGDPEGKGMFDVLMDSMSNSKQSVNCNGGRFAFR